MCVEGYKFENGICIPVCSDGIVRGLEECDDGNTIEFDGCYECQYSCP